MPQALHQQDFSATDASTGVSGATGRKRLPVIAWLKKIIACVPDRSHMRSAKQRAAVMKAAAQGDLSATLDAMMAWAIAERRAGR